MSDDMPPPDDLGPPPPELTDLEWPADEAFVGRVHRRIERRVLAGDLVELAWSGPLAAVLALIRLPVDWFTHDD